MYTEDSYFTLSQGGQLGLAALSAFLTLTVLALTWGLVRGRRLWVRLAIGLLVFWLFVWLSPQVYYAYYRLIIEGLPRQWVIGWPDLLEPVRYLSFSGPPTLSAHGQGVLGWGALLVAAFRR